MSSRSPSPFAFLHRRSTRGRPESTGPPPTEPRSNRSMQRLERRRTVEERHFNTARAQSLKLNPPVDLRMLDYVTEYDSNLMCAICRCPFIEPVILRDCDHCFCKDCINQTWTMAPSSQPTHSCPTCRVVAKQIPRSSGKVLNNILDDLAVRCPNSEDGCDTKLKRSEVQDHVNLYCQHAYVECPKESCVRPVRRKDSNLYCQHSRSCCLQCRKEVRVAELETHWRSACPVRSVVCHNCQESIPHRDLMHHQQATCSYANTTCPGMALGCQYRGMRPTVDTHTKDCAFAKLAPIVLKQTKRLDEQEAAQKHMARKLVILEDGFSNVQSILESTDSQSSADTRSSVTSSRSGYGAQGDRVLGQNDMFNPARASSTAVRSRTRDRHGEGRENRELERVEPMIPIGYDATQQNFQFASIDHAPYTSPHDHLLSMHETLREEVTRISLAIQEVDGRHSMQNLNENLRTRDEITYLGAQVAGLSRQVQWLTSTQLQRTPAPRMSTSGSADGPAASSNAEAGVEAAVNAVNAATNYIRNATRPTNNGSGTPSRRGSSAEGRTKL